MSNESTPSEETPAPAEPATADDISIKPGVVASLARLCALDVDGVYAVGKGGVDRLAEILFKHETGRGVRVSEDAHGDYLIDIRVLLQFGAPLRETAQKIQDAVRERVQKMTGKPVAHVHICVDGVRAAPKKQPATEELPHTD